LSKFLGFQGIWTTLFLYLILLTSPNVFS